MFEEGSGLPLAKERGGVWRKNLEEWNANPDCRWQS